MASSACGVKRPPMHPDYMLCPALGEVPRTGDPGIRWIMRTQPDERPALDAWCWAVGPAVYRRAPEPVRSGDPAPGGSMLRDSAEVDAAKPAVAGGRSAPPVDGLTVVVWNAHVGRGDFDRLVADLRAGRLTGGPEEHFVMLLQEVRRSGAAVPAEVPAWAATARRVDGGHAAGRPDIAALAARHGLSLLYAPSMRNGPAGESQPEDRGNAILSTMPLSSPVLFELPFERQRRVAVLARVEGRTSSGTPWSLRLASAHLDNRARFGRIHRSFGAAIERQAAALADALQEGGAAVLGADLNTWLSGADAAATRRLRRTLPQPAVLPDEPTAELPGPIPDRQLDYLMFRVPDDWSAEYSVAGQTYGSDHRPLIGRVAFTTATSASGPDGASDPSREADAPRSCGPSIARTRGP